MNNCSTKRHNKYDKEMDHAFTLIFHNIKRLQDGRLCNSTPSLDQVDVQSEIKPAMALKVPFHRARCRSDPSLGLPEEDMAHRVKLSGARAKSGSFCGSDASPLQRRKVRFADDYATKDKLKPPPLTKRPWSDLQPLIVVTKESWYCFGQNYWRNGVNRIVLCIILVWIKPGGLHWHVDEQPNNDGNKL